MNPSQPKNQRVHLKTLVPGPRSTALRVREDLHLAPGVQNYAITTGIAVDRARGSEITDVDGNTFLDFIGGIAVGALGHSHPVYTEALAAQLGRVTVGSLTSEARVELTERLAAHAPAPGVHKVQLYSSGAEAVESALRLAKSHTRKSEFVSFWGAFHGKTMGALSLMGSTFKEGLGPMVPGAHLVPYADCYRCPLGLSEASCGLACVDVARQAMKVQPAGPVAAVIMEPMQGTAGNVIPPDAFAPAMAAAAKDLGALFIADEMITGFGRTGKPWGVDHSGAKPDIVTLGKGFGSGFPISGVLTRTDIAQAKPWSNPSGSSSSYGGNALAAAAAHASVSTIRGERLWENAEKVGAAMVRELRRMQERHPFVGDVRGRGLYIGVELVKDKKTKEPLDGALMRQVYGECVRRGLLAMTYTPHVRLQPALTIDEPTALEGLAILDEVFTDLERRTWR
jgi:4-aminobutyrate aminotransferase-like enzyme